jgi:hypothetical protein
MQSLVSVRRAALLALATAALGGCEEAGDPSRNNRFNAQRALSDYRAVDALIDAAAMRSFAALESRLPSGVMSSAWRTPTLQPSSVPLISEGARGKTFIYSAAADQYVVDPARTGAPNNGVRFILYAVDPATGKPNPARETGRADLIDLGNTGNDHVQLRLVAVSDGRTFLDYSLVVDPRDGGGSIGVEGFLADAENRLDFDIDVDGRTENGRGRVDVDFHLAIEGRDFRVDGSVRGAEGEDSNEGDLDLVARHRDESVRVTATGTDDAIDASFFLNGQLLATAVGPHDSPVIRGRDGSEQLSPDEWLALAYIVHFGEGIFELVGCLVKPVEGLIGLAILL